MAKILMLDPSASSCQVTHNLCNALADLGHEVDLYTSPYWAQSVGMCEGRRYRPVIKFFKRTQLRAYQAKNKMGKYFWQAARLIGYFWSWTKVLHFARQYDLVHVQILAVPSVDVFFLRILSKRVPLVYTVHDLIPHDTRQRRLKSLIFRQIYKLPQVLFVHTESTAQGLSQEFGVDPIRIVKIRHGSLQHLLELPLLSNSSAGSDAPILLFLGKIRRDKGLDILLKAAVHLRETGTRFEVLVAGSPSIKMQPIFEFVEQQDLVGHIRFRLGFIEEIELPDLFRSATLVVLPYREVAQSGVAIGACTFGKAIVATRCGGFTELIEEAQNGKLVPLDDAIALAGAIQELLENADLRHHLEVNSQRYAETALAWPEIANTTATAYQRALEPRGLPGPHLQRKTLQKSSSSR